MNDDSERDRALLTTPDREHLRGEREHQVRQSRDRAERRIASRTREGLRDLRLLQREASGRLLKRVYDGDPPEQRELRDDMVAAIALLYEIHELCGWDFEETLERAVEEAHLHGPSREGSNRTRQMDLQSVKGVEFTADTEPALAGRLNEINDRIRDKIRREEPLTDSEVRHVVQYGEVGVRRRLRDYLRERDRERYDDKFIKRMESDIEQFGSETFFPAASGDGDAGEGDTESE